MFKWRKLGRIFNPQDVQNLPWMKEFAQCTSALVFDKYVRVYFSCRPCRDQEGEYVSNTGFVDLDINNLFNILQVSQQPVLPLGDLGAFDSHGVYPTCTLRYQDQVWLYYAGWSRCKDVPFNTAIGLAISRDGGTTFQRLGTGPIVSSSLNEPFVISGPKVRRFNGQWQMYYLAGSKWILNNGRPEIVYKIRMACSNNGLDWDKINKNLIPDVLEENECQAGPDVFFKDNKYHMYFVYRYAVDFRQNPNHGYRIGYATSDDMYTWVRDDTNVGIEYSTSGWDSTMQHYPHIFVLHNKHYMLYNGNEFGRWGFGLAEAVND